MNKHTRAAAHVDQQRGGVAVAFSSGPLPPAAELERYNTIVPGFAERLLAMTERQAAHRQAIESHVIKHEVIRSYAGMLCGLLIGLGGLAAGTYIAVEGQPWAGSIIGGGTLAALVGVFIKGSQGRQQELERKAPPDHQ